MDSRCYWCEEIITPVRGELIWCSQKKELEGVCFCGPGCMEAYEKWWELLKIPHGMKRLVSGFVYGNTANDLLHV